MNRIPLDAYDPIHQAALNAINNSIDRARSEIPESVATSATHPTPGVRDQATSNALNQALRLRKLETAARQLGENLDRYLPAVYRTPPIHRPSSDGEHSATVTAAAPATPGAAGGAECPPAGDVRPQEPATCGHEAQGDPPSPVSVPAGGLSGAGRDQQPQLGDRLGAPSPPSVTAPGPSRLQPCCQAMPPEHFDHCRLVAKITDRRGPRYVSPLGATRERQAACTSCRQPTMANDGLCDRCALEHQTNALAHLDSPAREALLR